MDYEKTINNNVIPMPKQPTWQCHNSSGHQHLYNDNAHGHHRRLNNNSRYDGTTITISALTTTPGVSGICLVSLSVSTRRIPPSFFLARKPPVACCANAALLLIVRDSWPSFRTCRATTSSFCIENFQHASWAQEHYFERVIKRQSTQSCFTSTSNCTPSRFDLVMFYPLILFLSRNVPE